MMTKYPKTQRPKYPGTQTRMTEGDSAAKQPAMQMPDAPEAFELGLPDVSGSACLRSPILGFWGLGGFRCFGTCVLRCLRAGARGWLAIATLCILDAAAPAAAEPGRGSATARSCELVFYSGYLHAVADFPGLQKQVIFAFDTGTTQLAVRPAFAAQLGLPTNGMVRLSFNLGEIQVRHAKAAVWEHPRWRPAWRLARNRIYGGILALDPVFLERYTVIDYPNGRLSVYPALPPNADMRLNGRAGTVAPLLSNGGQLFVEATVDDRATGYFHIDTGLPGASRLLPRIAHQFGISGGRLCRSFFVGHADIGRQHIKLWPTDYAKGPFDRVELTNIIGTLGAHTLRNFQIHLDFANRRIAFVRP